MLFLRYSELFVKSCGMRILTYPTCILHPHLELPSSNFAKTFGVQKLESMGYHVAVCSTVCMTQSLAILIQYRHLTDGQTDGHTTIANTAQEELRGKSTAEAGHSPRASSSDCSLPSSNSTSLGFDLFRICSIRDRN